jgi:Tol biopolymer transport system component
MLLIVAAGSGCGDSTHALLPTSQLAFIRSAAIGSGASTMSRHAMEPGGLRFPGTPHVRAAGIAPLLNATASGTDSIVTMKNDGTGETMLASQTGWFGSVQLSLDGKMGVGTVEDDNGYMQIYVVNMTSVHNLQPVKITSDAQQHYYPQLSPDNSTVVFMQYDPSNEQGFAYTIKASGGTETKISTPLGIFVNFPTFTPDGKKIVFEEENNDTINIMNLNGTGIKTLTNGDGTAYFDECPSVSPDGTKIVFSRYGKDVETVGEDIYIANIDGTSVKQLTTDGNNWDPMFVNDKILFVSHRDNAGGSEIYSMNLDGTSVKRLTNNNVNDAFIGD